jgi:hypothetical protein
MVKNSPIAPTVLNKHLFDAVCGVHEDQVKLLLDAKVDANSRHGGNDSWDPPQTLLWMFMHDRSMYRSDTTAYADKAEKVMALLLAAGARC